MKFLKWIISFTSRTTNLIFVIALLISLSASYISPNKIWFLPFAGLLLPLLVVINIIFVVIWIFRKRHFAVVSLLAIGACLPQLLRLTATNIGKPKADNTATVIKIMSYNVRDFDLYNWSENENSKEKIFETIKLKNPDIICFQEFYTDSSKRYNTIQQLQNLGYTHYFFTKELVLRKTDEWGISLFSKLPIKEHGNIMKQDFKTGYGKKPFKGLYADIEIGDTVIRFVNVHLQSIYFGTQDYETIEEFRSTQNLDETGAKSIIIKLKKAFERRANQADELKAFLNVQTKPVVLCGDFNDLPNSYVSTSVSENMKDVFLDYSFGIGHTYNGKIPFLRIDYILTSPAFQVHKFEVVSNKISDHFPLYTELSLPK
jgi:endonuclease/exonuclease/phosphatase family metal-dependent hydrolase